METMKFGPSDDKSVTMTIPRKHSLNILLRIPGLYFNAPIIFISVAYTSGWREVNYAQFVARFQCLESVSAKTNVLSSTRYAICDEYRAANNDIQKLAVSDPTSNDESSEKPWQPPISDYAPCKKLI
ncbi:hypothetical protein KSP40_PGU016680 [Platanthera guangdongensis]|uniref:Uncharacterized protein n=1 Tax=Platanthera guangdongensis TaxID=2320717 RepID=A0ABR2MFW9_9ASPA